MKRFFYILLNILPIIAMIWLISIIKNDYILTLAYIGIISIALNIKREHNDVKVLLAGFVCMTLSEYIFISTGVEKFMRVSLLGMPLWLPFLWAYGFIVIKRIIQMI